MAPDGQRPQAGEGVEPSQLREEREPGDAKAYKPCERDGHRGENHPEDGLCHGEPGRVPVQRDSSVRVMVVAAVVRGAMVVRVRVNPQRDVTDMIIGCTVQQS